MKRHIYRHRVIDSTNDEAKRLIEKGEPHGTLIIADEQTAGRGRSGRSWVTPPMSAIAMSLILRPTAPPHDSFIARVPAGVLNREDAVGGALTNHLTQISLLGGLAVLEGIKRAIKLTPQLKWPNDVLINGSKVAGVLAESLFVGDRLEAVIVGMGVNVNAAPPPDLKLEYPATCLAEVLGHQVDREKLIEAIIESFDARYSQLGTPSLTEAWSAHLAMKGQGVQVVGITETIRGTLEGVTGEGALLIRLATGEIKMILAGDVHLRA